MANKRIGPLRVGKFQQRNELSIHCYMNFLPNKLNNLTLLQKNRLNLRKLFERLLQQYSNTQIHNLCTNSDLSKLEKYRPHKMIVLHSHRMRLLSMLCKH